MRRFSIQSTASSCGKTTLGRELARRLEVPFVELDALHHGPGWTEATAEELRAKVEPIVAGDAWVIDGGYWGKLGDLILTVDLDVFSRSRSRPSTPSRSGSSG